MTGCMDDFILDSDGGSLKSNWMNLLADEASNIEKKCTSLVT